MIGRRSDPSDKVGVAGVDDLGGVLAQPDMSLDPSVASQRPMESGYCATCTSGKAPLAPKSFCHPGTRSARLP